MSVRRTIVLSDELDRALQNYLEVHRADAEPGGAASLSRFIEEAVADKLIYEALRREPGADERPGDGAGLGERFDEVVANLKRRTRDLTDDEVMGLIDEALAQTR